MPHPALIETVRRSTADAVAAVWAEARAEAARCRDNAQHTVDAKRAELDSRLRAISKDTLRDALTEAERRARGVRTLARAAFAERLWTLAQGALHQLRDAAYPRHFRALAAELPDRVWTRVAVSPADESLAREVFAGSAVVVTDATITGGLIAQSDGLRVTNTLDRRLAAAWPDLQPTVWNDVIDQQTRPQPVA